MKYVLLICDNEVDPPSHEELAVDPVHDEFQKTLDRRGTSLGGARLRPSMRPVSGSEGEVLVTDGPFAETKDFVGGITILECADLDDAIEIASKHPYARRGVVEIRPVWE